MYSRNHSYLRKIPFGCGVIILGYAGLELPICGQRAPIFDRSRKYFLVTVSSDGP